MIDCTTLDCAVTTADQAVEGSSPFAHPRAMNFIKVPTGFLGPYLHP